MTTNTFVYYETPAGVSELNLDDEVRPIVDGGSYWDFDMRMLKFIDTNGEPTFIPMSRIYKVVDREV